jgi:NAD(P)H-hydrate epimerase
MRVLTSAEILQAEREAVSRPGGSSQVLMQAAGYAVTQFCLAQFKFSSVAVVCGKGKAGGQAMVAAESLHRMTKEVSVIILAGSMNELEADAAAMCSRLTIEPIWASSDADLEAENVRQALESDLIIDAIAGMENQRTLGTCERKAVNAINAAFGTVISVDLPSGINPDSRVPAHHTEEDAVFAHGVITFMAPKPAHLFGELTSGPIAVSEIGVQPALVSNPSQLEVITGQEVGIAFPPRAKDAHKGEFGHVLVIAGSAGKAGAAGLAAMAALHTGAGLVTVACPKSIQATVAGFAAEAMTEGLAETPVGTISLTAKSHVEDILLGKDVLVLGPGLSTHPETSEFVRWLVGQLRVPLVLDADGLNAFTGHYEELKESKGGALFRVLTPHPGEAARLLDVSTKDIQSDRLEVAKRVSHETGCCMVLKGSRTIVAGASGETWINMSGNPALAKGGSGDVLSGMIGAALARKHDLSLHSAVASAAADPEPVKTWMHEIYGRDSKDKLRQRQAEHLRRNIDLTSSFLKDVSVAAAVHLHGLAADIARDALHENAVLARDVMESLWRAFRECDEQMERGLFYLQK